MVLMFTPYFTALLLNLVGSWLMGLCTSLIAKVESWLPIQMPAPTPDISLRTQSKSEEVK